MEEHDLMTTNEVAAKLRVHRRTVNVMCRDGRLDAIRLGNRGDYRVKRASLEALLNSSVKTEQ